MAETQRSHIPSPESFLAVMRRYHQEGIVFTSPTQGKNYCVESVDESGCNLKRLKVGGTIQRLTTSTLSWAWSVINTNGGRAPIATLCEKLYRVDIAAITQCPELAIDIERKFVVDIRDEAAAIRLLAAYVVSLRVDKSQGSPKLFKPALVAAVIDGIADGTLTSNRLEYGALVGRTQARLKQLGLDASRQQIVYGFFHLASEPFWLLAYRNPDQPISSSDGLSESKLQECVTHATLKEPFWTLLQEPANRQQIQSTLATKWWPERVSAERVSERLDDMPHVSEESDAPMPYELNTILYGPPGTGKTHDTIRRAVEICDGVVSENRDETVTRFRALQEEERIAFVTFHQSYGYEDFIEGIRPVIREVNEDVEVNIEGGSGSELQYEYHEGVFKRMVDLAIGSGSGAIRSKPSVTVDPANTQVWKMSLGNTLDPAQASIYEECIANGWILLGYGYGLDFTGLDSREAILKKIQAEAKEPFRVYHVTAVHAFKNKMKVGDLVIVSDGNRKFRAIGRVAGPYEFADDRDPPYKQRRKVEWIFRTEQSLPREKIMTKVFSQATIYQLHHAILKLDALQEFVSAAVPVGPKNHVLVIDEINRGNIAKILGELITLLEPDKRIGEENELRVTLPYSGENFGVPSNLYIVGTMNTADRSIAMLDAALRRRFEFEELMPDSGVIRSKVGEKGVVAGVDVSALLDTLNSRIELLFDRDHQIGHSYFLGVDGLSSLRQVMLKKVIPLLQEYFYGDWAKVCLVLGCPCDADTGKPLTTNMHPLIATKLLAAGTLPGAEAADVEGRLTYRTNPDFAKADAADLPPYFQGIFGNGNVKPESR